MEAAAFVHLAPLLAHSNKRLLHISICLCCIILAFSLSVFGEFSLFNNPTLLIFSNKKRKGTRPIIGKRLPATATKASFSCASLISVLWCAAIAVLILFCVFAIQDDGDAGYIRVMPWLEWVFALGEVVVMIMFGVGGIKERKAILGMGDGTRKWNRPMNLEHNVDSVDIA